MPTRLELHRLTFRRDGGRAALLSYSDLSADELQVLSSEIFGRASTERGTRGPFEVMVSVLADWGVMCTHPEHRRAESGSKMMDGYFRSWFMCELCGSHVLETPDLSFTPVAQKGP